MIPTNLETSREFFREEAVRLNRQSKEARDRAVIGFGGTLLFGLLATLKDLPLQATNAFVMVAFLSLMFGVLEAGRYYIDSRAAKALDS